MIGVACSNKKLTPGLLKASELGTVRGLHLTRVITHFHTPYSFDACDSKGLDSSLTPANWCIQDIKFALCQNHIDFAMVSDHANHMATTSFSNLLIPTGNDVILTNSSGNPVANQIACDGDDFHPILAPGLEGKLLALGMENHIAGSDEVKTTTYGGEDAATKTTLETQTNALVLVPHTESRSLDLLRSLSPDGIEIYNLHANLDPKIRKTSLGLPPFEHVAKFMNYLIDPGKDLDADYLFMEFFEYADIYFSKWNKLLSEGYHITGVGGLDSHQNIFSQSASDGERLDHHRRMTRIMNNFVLTASNEIASIKAAIRAGKVYFVLEGLGTPYGLDFYGLLNQSTVTEMGGTLTVASPQTSSIEFKVPVVHPSFPGMGGLRSPDISSELHYIDANGTETVVLSSQASSWSYPEPPAGNYRVHVFMRPHHLQQFIFDKSLENKRYQWIISNPIKVVR